MNLATEWVRKQEARDVPQVIFSSLVSLPKLEQPFITMLLADLNDTSSIQKFFPVDFSISLLLDMAQEVPEPEVASGHWTQLPGTVTYLLRM